jgi:membrane fusion protein (multidrug efflux system)
MRRFAPLLLAASLTVALAACGGSDEGKTGGAPGGGGAAGGPPPVSVEAVTLQPEPLEAGLRTVGTLRADESVVVRPEIAGRIVAIHFEEGAQVARGAPLFTLDASVLRAELNEAQATLGKSQRSAARAEELAQRALVAKSDVDTLRAELDVTRARVASAQAQLAKTTLEAPFDGVLGLREVSIGEVVNPGQALVSLVRLDPIEVDFSLPESELGRVTLGQTLGVEVDAFAGRAFSGTVSALDPVVDVASRSAKVRATIANPDHALRPGQFARITLAPTGGARQALLLPEQALLQQGDTRYVYRVVGGKALRAEVQTGRRVPGKIEIVSGLSAGDQVITAGQSKPMMFDGAAVSVAGAAPAATADPATAVAPGAPAAASEPAGERAAARDDATPQGG